MEMNIEKFIVMIFVRFLFAYQRSPHTTTGVKPAELIKEFQITFGFAEA